MTQLEHYLNHLQRFGIRPGLERMRALLELSGEPQAKYPVVLVGGTNGKGSSCEFLARTLAREGKTVGLYTSPHLYQWNERIRVLDQCNAMEEGFAGVIADDELDRLFNDLRPHIEAVAATENGQATEFETLTYLGFHHFAAREVDVAIVEVGLGGHYDATNVCEPLVSVVTHVALDHCDRLGSTHSEIARDKVHIARADRILITAETRDDVLQVFRAHCDEINARLWSFRNVEYSNDRIALETALSKNEKKLSVSNTEKDFQQLNLETARIARLALANSDTQFSINENGASINEKWSVPGRFQIVRNKPLLVLDGANNPDGAQVLAAQLKRVLEARPEAKLTLVLGILADKDYASMIAHLAPLASRIIATQSNSPRACEARIIAGEARRFCSEVDVIVPVQDAVEAALHMADEIDVVCVTGSFFTIADYVV